jgi:cation:H+ antiporter
VWYGGEFSRIDAILSLLAFAVLLPISCWLERKNGSTTQDTIVDIAPVKHPIIWTLWGLVLLVGSSHFLVWGAVDIARTFGISELMGYGYIVINDRALRVQLLAPKRRYYRQD